MKGNTIFPFFSVQKTNEDYENLIEKYEKDVEQLKILNSTLDTTIAEKEKEVLGFDEALRDKDAVIHSKKLRINTLEIEVSELQLKEENQNQIVKSLVKIQATLDPTTENVSSLCPDERVLLTRSLRILLVSLRVCVLLYR